MLRKSAVRLAILFGLLGSPLSARADITIGAVLSLTGPAAGLGIPERNTIDLLPRVIGGQTVRFIILDDASDSTAAVKAARKLIDEDKVDIILGPSNTPNSLALIDVVAGAQTPMISLAGCGQCIEPQTGPRRWVFKLVPGEKLMMDLIAAHMQRNAVHSFADFAFATAFGDAFAGQMDVSAKAVGITPLLTVRYNPADTSVTPQALRIMAAKPDAVFIAASATPGATPIVELRNRGFTGLIYANQGIASAEFLRVGGKALEGLVFPVCPVLVAEQLADNDPIKPAAVAYVSSYEAKFGPGSRSLPGASLWDAFLLTARGAEVAMQTTPPGTSAFRTALRDAMERTQGLVGSQGIFNLTPEDHSGSDQRAQILVTVRNGVWTLLR